jgi:hypothetical protein
VTADIEAILRKIEYWHQGSISSFKIMCRDGIGFWNGVHWNGKTASSFALPETDERKSLKKTPRPKLIHQRLGAIYIYKGSIAYGSRCSLYESGRHL